MIHKQPSEFAGQTVRIKSDVKHPQYEIAGKEFQVEDWSDRVMGVSWMNATGNPAALVYAMRTGLSKKPIPTDNEVLYGKIGPFGHLIHISEIEPL